MKRVGDSFYYDRIFRDEEGQDIIENAESHEKESNGYLCNRLLVCVFALCVLWTTTLANCVALVHIFLPTPTFTSVKRHCVSFLKTVDESEQAYRTCISQQLNTCDRNLDISVKQQQIRILRNHENNIAFEQIFNLKVNNCSVQSNDLVNGLFDWVSNGMNSTIPYQQGVCTKDQLLSLSALIGDQTSTASSIQSSSTDYISTSNGRIASLITYSDALSAYNQEYVRNKTKNIHLLTLEKLANFSLAFHTAVELQGLGIQNISIQTLACLSLNPNISRLCPYPLNAVAIYTDHADYLNAAMEVGRRSMEAIEKTVLSFQGIVSKATENMNQFYQSIASARGIMNWLLSNGLIPSVSFLCGKSSPNWCNFTPFDWYIPLLQVPLNNFFPNMPDVGEIWHDLEGISLQEQQLLQLQLTSFQLEMATLATDLLSDIDGLEWEVFSDYNPPSYQDPTTPDSNRNLSEVLADQLSTSKVFQNQLYRAIYLQNSSTVTELGNTSTTSSYLLNLANNLQSSLLSSVSTMWVSFEAGNLNYQVWLSSFNTIQSVLFFFDYLYRILQSMKLIVQFWHRGIVQLPVISLLTIHQLQNPQKEKRDHVGYSPVTSSSTTWFTSITSSSLFSTIPWIMRILPYLWIQLLGFLIVMIMIGLIIATLLIPEYNSYVNACVIHNQRQTFLSRNIAALAINYASYTGNRDLTIGINRYNNEMVLQCKAQQQDSSSSSQRSSETFLSSLNNKDRNTNDLQSIPSYSSYLQALSTTNTSFAKVIDNWELLQSCIDWERLQEMMSKYCQANDYHSLQSNKFCQVTLSPSNPTQTTTCNRHHLLSATLFSATSPSLSSNYSQRDTNMNRTTSDSSSLMVTSDDMIQSPYQYLSSEDPKTIITTNLTELVYYNPSWGRTRSHEFYCHQLPACEITCTGPDQLVLQNTAKDCSCMLEWYWNAILLQGTMAITIYVIVNLSRVLIQTGILKVFWKALTPAVYECQVYCNEEGQLLLTPPDENKSATSSFSSFSPPSLSRFQDNPFYHTSNVVDIKKVLTTTTARVNEEIIQSVIRHKMQQFVNSGYFRILMGLSLNIVWLYALLQFSQQLEYQPHYLETVSDF